MANKYSQIVAARATAAGITGGGSSVTVSDTAPSTPSAGDQWFNSTDGSLYVYYNDGSSSQWVGVSGPAGAAGAGGGVTSYANKTAIDAVSSPSEGDLAFDEDKNVLYIRAGSAWERVQHGSNVGPRFTTTPASTLFLSASGSTSTITAVAVDETGFPVTYDWDGFSGSTVYNSSSLPNQITNVSESNGVFTLTPSTNTSHAGAFTFRTKASDGAQVSLATTTVSLSFSTDITTPNTSPFNSAGTNSFDITVGQTNNSGSGLSSTLDQGKKYFELVQGAGTSHAYAFFGLCDATLTNPGYNTSGTVSIYVNNSKLYPGAITTSLTDAQNAGDIVMVAYDTSTREVWFGVNGTWYQDPSTTSSSYLIGTGSTTAFKIMFGNGESISRSYAGTINVGSNVVYSVPSGFSAH